MTLRNAICAKTIPTLLSSIRLLVIAPFAFLFYKGMSYTLWFAGSLVLVALLSDIFDGYLARKLKVTTELGGFLDALADKIFLNCIQFMLLGAGLLSGWLVFPLFVRDMLVDGLRNYIARRGSTLPHNWYGKSKAGAQYAAIFLSLGHLLEIQHLVSDLNVLANWFLLLALLLGLLSARRLLEHMTATCRPPVL